MLTLLLTAQVLELEAEVSSEEVGVVSSLTTSLCFLSVLIMRCDFHCVQAKL